MPLRTPTPCKMALSVLAVMIGPGLPATVEVVRFTSQPSAAPVVGPVSVIDGRHVWVGLTYTSDSGASWVARLPADAETRRFLDIPSYGQSTLFTSVETGWLSGVDSVWMTNDGGLTWRPQVHGRIGGLVLTGKAGWMVAGDSRTSLNYTTTDSGQNWSRCGPQWDYSLVGPGWVCLIYRHAEWLDNSDQL